MRNMEILTTWVGRELTTELTTGRHTDSAGIEINVANGMSLAYDNGM